jgi:thiol-disulfide isomerase/thioredoxin
MRKTLFALSILLCSVAAIAQSHVISGTATYPNGTSIRLWKTTGRSLDVADSTTITANSFIFKGNYGEGLYALGLTPSNMAIIAIDNAELETTFAVQGARWDSGITCKKGNSNILWNEYVKKENEFTQKKKALNIRWKKDKDSTAEKELTDLEASFNAYQLECIQREKQTTKTSFVSQLIDWKREPSKDKVKYWDNLNFSDARVVHTTVLNDRIQNFMRQFSKGTESGFIDCIGLLTEKAHANDRVYEFVLNEMLTGFYESGMENITLYLMDNFINDESCGDDNFSNVIKRNAESIERVSVGKTPPNITANDLNNVAFDLKKTCASNQYTLLIFWSSWCSHCKTEAPKIAKLSKDYAGRKIAFVGYSVDNDANAWKQAVTEREFTFTNLCGMKGWDSKGAKDFRITKTPAFFILDKNMRIVTKPKSPEEIELFFKLSK